MTNSEPDENDVSSRDSDASRPDIDAEETVSDSVASVGGAGVRNFEPMTGSFGRYEIEKELGRGGMGAVYRAHDTELDRIVALKVPFIDESTPAETVDRFNREARAMASLRHPNLCPVHDVGRHEGFHYLTMAYIEGESLSGWLKENPDLPAGAIAEMTRKLALALEAAHEQGVVHRDLKPSNVMVETGGEPIILDFGLALRDCDEEAEITRSNVIMGSPSYMAPEQVEGKKFLVGPQTDVYALGVVLYWMLTGRAPYEGTVGSLMAQVVNSEPHEPLKLNPDVPEALQAICLKAMSKRVKDRYQSAAEMADALGDFLEGRPIPIHPVRDKAAPFKALPVFAVLTVVIGLAALAAALLKPDPPNSSPEPNRPGAQAAVSTAVENTARLLPLRPVASTPSDVRLFDAGQRLGDSDSRSVRVADLDGDGDPDAFVANAGLAPNRVWLNDDGVFSDSGQSLGESDSVHVALGDLNGDGSQDAFVCNAGGQSAAVWLNDGLAKFAKADQTLEAGETRQAVLGDFDGDGDLDAGVAVDGANVIWLNDGKGQFSLGPEPFGESDTVSLLSGDFDGDGDLDLFAANVGSTQGLDKLWLNQGDGVFVESDDRLASTSAILAGPSDFDGDGVPELFSISRTPQLINIYKRQPGGGIISSRMPASQSHQKAVVADVNGDGLEDLLAAQGNGYTVYFNRDLRSLSKGRGSWHGAGTLQGFDLGDFDGDGDLDVFVANGEGEANLIWANRTEQEIKDAALFTQSPMRFPIWDSSAVSLGDVDGDGDLDAVIGGRGDTPNKLWLNDGAGIFVEDEQEFDTFECFAVAIVDLDNDGDLDLLLANRGGPSRVWFNQGRGTFVPSPQEIGAAATDDIAVADFDGDGDLDFWAANLNPFVDKVWQNDGKGHFTDSGTDYGSPRDRAWAVHAADVDGDEDIDVLVGTATSAPNSLWLNQGNGRFERSPQELSGVIGSNGFAPGDLDGDGAVDLFEAVNGNVCQVWMNTGNVNFVRGHPLHGAFPSERAILEDFDMDGDLDAVVINARNQPNMLWRNDGAGRMLALDMGMGNASSYGIAAGDLDGDGDVDLFVVNGRSSMAEPGQRDEIWLNKARSLNR